MIIEGGYLQYLTALWALGEKGTGLPIVTIQLTCIVTGAAPAAEGTISGKEYKIYMQFILNCPLYLHLGSCILGGLRVGDGTLA